MVGQFFSDARVYSQGEAVFPAHLSRVLAARFLERIHVKELIKRLLRRPAVPAAQTEFSTTPPHSEHRISPYRPGWLSKPPYLIVVARKV